MAPTVANCEFVKCWRSTGSSGFRPYSSRPARMRSVSRGGRQSIYFLVFLLSALIAAGDTPAVIIPGIIKRKPIEFAPNLGLAPFDADIVFPLTPRGLTAPQEKIGVNVNHRDVRTQRVVSHEWFVLSNPQLITGLGTPIPLEAPLAINFKKSPQEATIGGLIPDSVAAWHRLKTWEDVRKGIKDEQMRLIDVSADEVEKVVQLTLANGELDSRRLESLSKAYITFTYQLGVAFDANSKNPDLQNALSSEISGAREERLAWGQVPQSLVPILNKRYPPDSPPQQGMIDKSASFGGCNTYDGFQQLQVPRPALQYKYIYQQSRATVAICEAGGNPFATGAIIGHNLVLTCAHSVARPGRGGIPAVHDVEHLTIRIGYDYPRDPNTPIEDIDARIVYQGEASEGFSDRLDFALLEADVAGYEERQFFKAQNAANKAADPSNQNDDKRKLLRETAFWAIDPLPLANFDVNEIDGSFNIIGFPEGQPKRVCNNGKVLFPHRIPETVRDELRKTINTEAVRENISVKKLSEVFELMYVIDKDPLYRRYTYDTDSPGIGVICPTVPGNSGSPAILKNQDAPAIFGILVAGQPGSFKPWNPGIAHHEILLPTTAIIRQLKDFNGIDGEVPFGEPWYKHYKVRIYDKNKPGTIVARKF